MHLIQIVEVIFFFPSFSLFLQRNFTEKHNASCETYYDFGLFGFFSVKVDMEMRNLLNNSALQKINKYDIALFCCSICNILHKFCKKMSNGCSASGVSLLISLLTDNLNFKY